MSAESSFIGGLRRAWVTIQLPGVAVRRPGTYVEHDVDRIPPAPPVPSAVDGWTWLRDAPAHERCMAVDEETRSRWLDSSDRLPDDFVTFAREPDLARRLRSATDCYFDPADHVVDVPGGRLVHFVSDSQWVMHWLLFVGDDAATAVVATAYPTGFDLDEDDLESWASESGEVVVVASSFAEFVWRWWHDNEVFFGSWRGGRLSDELAAYVAGYPPAAP